MPFSEALLVVKLLSHPLCYSSEQCVDAVSSAMGFLQTDNNLAGEPASSTSTNESGSVPDSSKVLLTGSKSVAFRRRPK